MKRKEKKDRHIDMPYLDVVLEISSDRRIKEERIV